MTTEHSADALLGYESQRTSSGEDMICPYCDYRHGDASKYCSSDQPHRAKCDGCGREFIQWAEYDVTYYAQPIRAAIPARNDPAAGGGEP